MKVEIRGKSPYKGSKHPDIGYLYVILITFIAIVLGNVLSGGMIPVDPTGPYGPPTLPPYSELNTIEEQRIIMPSDTQSRNDTKKLQLKWFKVNVCMQKVAVDFLIDTSGSMQYLGKINKTKEALTAFTKKMSPSAVIGIHTFHARADERVRLGYYRDNKVQVEATIRGLEPKGWTSMRDGFNKSKQALTEAITKNKFPGYKYVLVLLSDGVPEIPGPNRTCRREVPEPAVDPPLRCFAIEQDPRVPTNLAQDLKNIGVEIYSIGIYESNFESDRLLQPYLEELLRDVASEPKNTYYLSTLNNGTLTAILDKIFSSLCDDELGYPENIGPYNNP